MKRGDLLYKIGFREYELTFKKPAWTSRGILKRRKILLLLLKVNDLNAGLNNHFLTPHPTRSSHYKQQLAWLVRTRVPIRGGGWTKEKTFNEDVTRASASESIFMGEAAPLAGLSYECMYGGASGFFNKMEWMTREATLSVAEMMKHLVKYPALRFAFEMALRAWRYAALSKIHIKEQGSTQLKQLNFNEVTGGALAGTKNTSPLEQEASLPINGLIWMGAFNYLHAQVDTLLARKFRCLKMKVGYDLTREEKLLAYIRSRDDEISIRLDFNGALHSYTAALSVLKRLAVYRIHSVEQPLPPASTPEQRNQLQKLIQHTPITLALDEELIGLFSLAKKKQLLAPLIPFKQRVAFVLKPTLLGGFSACEEWISLAERYDIGWWVTSTLESAIGLEQICTWLYPRLKRARVALPQGLGTGELFVENFPSNLYRVGDTLKWSG